MIAWSLLLLYFVVLSLSLPRIFAKAGLPVWQGYIPLYNLVVWNKLLGKPWYWTIVLLVPGINLLMLIIYNVNTSIAFGDRSLKDHVLMVLLPWYFLPKYAFGAQYNWQGAIPIGEAKRGMLGQWGDAILFAVIVATSFRTFTFEAFTIPTGSMEKSLLIGDYLFVSKLSYGPRTPMTPITFPFTHHTMPLTAHTPSFSSAFSLPYKRLPGFGTPKKGDAVVFNFPEGDTVVANMQNASYYDLVRRLGRDNVVNKGHWFGSNAQGQAVRYETGGLLVRPIDKRENYIKRCVAVAGETVEVRDGEVYVDGVAQPLPATGQYAYQFILRDAFNRERLKNDLDVNLEDQRQSTAHSALLPLTAERAALLKGRDNVMTMSRVNKPRGYYTPGDGNAWPIFPNDPRFDWTEDNFGPLWVPKAGASIDLTLENLPLYRRVIAVYEGNDLRVEGNTILINGSPAKSYTFKQDHYWMMGDNRHHSLDARFWGFVPHDHVVGKAVLVWLTVDPEKGGFPGGIRWKRLFSLVH